jgi:double zinc ribbon protein
MTQAAPPPAAPGPLCAACGAQVVGRYCSHCGAPAESGTCTACKTRLSPGARFCHRCGAPAGTSTPTARRERVAWLIAGAAVLVALLVVVWRVGGARPTVPDMGNAGNIVGGDTLPTRRAPDISGMSPRERFTRLNDRVMQAALAGDSQTVAQFAPMALGAYALLDTLDADARYHAAMINLTIGDIAGALALADTIQAGAPDHLFGDVIRGEIADRGNDTAALNRAYRRFLDHFDSELRSGRAEYADHRAILDDFRTRATASLPR